MELPCRPSMLYDDFINIVEGLQNKVEDGDLELMAVVARHMWFRRNFLVYGGVLVIPSQLVRKASESLHGFNLRIQE